MKSLLNRLVHFLLRTMHGSKSVSEPERMAYLAQAKAVNRELSCWLAHRPHEYIGLGQNCNASWYIKASGNKRASYPFDWVFTTPEIILDMLGDDFEAFLDRSKFIPHGTDAGHERYHEWFFGHRNPASSDKDHDYLKRCVERWNARMASKEPIVFVTIVLNEFEKRKRWRIGFTKGFSLPKAQTISDFDQLKNKLLSINPNCRFLFIEQYTEQAFSMNIQHKDDHSLWVKFNSMGINSGVQYVNRVDDEAMKILLSGPDQTSN